MSIEGMQAGAPSPRTMGGMKRRSVDLSNTNIVKTSLPIEGSMTPLRIEPAVENVDLPEWAASNRDFLQSKLQLHGAIQFRGFGLKSVADFEKTASSIYKELYGGYGDLPRAGSSERIYQSTPYPPDKPILFHNESSHLHSWPMKISFFCVQAAPVGGNTPILDCRRICNLMDPVILETFKTKGVMYVRNFIEGIDVPWQRFFHTEDHSVVEEMCRKDGVECEWTSGDGLRMRHRTHAVCRHPYTQDLVFFNQIQLHHISCLDAETRASLLSLYPIEDLPRNVYYGDGTPIEDSVMQELNALFWKECIQAPWDNGDVVMLDNMLTSHARCAYSGPRQICVAMGEMIDKTALSSL